ncbi:helicase-associated domain-containing protein [Calidifontibacter terrae]
MSEHRSFADDVRSRSPQQLAALLLARPDLITPPPTDLSALAARAATRSSVQRALETLTADRLQVLEALLAGQAVADDAATNAVLDDLWTRGLLWRNRGGLTPVRATTEVIMFPARLGPRWSDLTERPQPADLGAIIDRLSEPARLALLQLATRHPVAYAGSDSASDALRELIDAGLTFRRDQQQVVLPLEVGLAVRGDAGPMMQPPTATGTARPSADVDAAAGLAGLTLARHVEALGDLWATDPPPVMRKGGLSVREQRALEAELGLDPAETAFVTEIACAAGLFASDAEIDPHWRPTPRHDEWLEMAPAGRWATLVNAWWMTTRAPSLVGTRGSTGTINLLGPDAQWPMLHRRRHDVLGVLVELDGVPTAAELDALLHWHRPLRLPPGAPTQSGVVIREAEWLGLAIGNQLSQVGRILAGGLVDAASVEPLLPTLVDRVFIQGDLTAIAPGPLTDELHRLMHRAADVESRGGATVFRFSAGSLSTALDGGASPTELRAALTAASPSPLPQPLTYLIDEAAGRHGKTLVGGSSSYVRSDDTGALAALVADSELAHLGLRLLAPTVAVTSVPPTYLLDALRKAGHSALAESAEGVAIAVAAHQKRAPTPRVVPPTETTALDPERVREMAERLVTADATAPRVMSADDDPSVLLGALQDAAADGLPVWIGYVDASGDLRRSLFRPARVDGGRVVGTVGEDRRTFSVHRITTVSPA